MLTLLSDRTTGRNLLWNANGGDEITSVDLFTIVPRHVKRLEEKKKRTKKHAEVYTPLRVVKQMNDYLDDDFGKRPWQEYVDSRRLEITCGEAPFICSRYDAGTGEDIPLEKRVGILDRKLAVVKKNDGDRNWILRAVQSCYGYEFLGDSLYIARRNVLQTVYDYFGVAPAGLINVIVWNFFQMDGLTGKVAGQDALIYDWRARRKLPFNEVKNAGS